MYDAYNLILKLLIILLLRVAHDLYITIGFSAVRSPTLCQPLSVGLRLARHVYIT